MPVAVRFTVVEGVQRLEEMVHHAHHFFEILSGGEFLRFLFFVFLALFLRHEELEEHEFLLAPAIHEETQGPERCEADCDAEENAKNGIEKIHF